MGIKDCKPQGKGEKGRKKDFFELVSPAPEEKKDGKENQIKRKDTFGKLGRGGKQEEIEVEILIFFLEAEKEIDGQTGEPKGKYLEMGIVMEMEA